MCENDCASRKDLIGHFTGWKTSAAISEAVVRARRQCVSVEERERNGQGYGSHVRLRCKFVGVGDERSIEQKFDVAAGSDW